MTNYIWAIDTPWNWMGDEVEEDISGEYVIIRGFSTLKRALLSLGWIKPVEEKHEHDFEEVYNMVGGWRVGVKLQCKTCDTVKIPFITGAAGGGGGNGCKQMSEEKKLTAEEILDAITNSCVVGHGRTRVLDLEKLAQFLAEHLK